MKILETYSHLNGLEYLLVHKKKLWQEVKDIVAAVDAETCRTKISNEVRMRGELKFSPIEMNKRFSELLQAKKWKESRVSYWVTRNERLIRNTMSLPPEEQKKQIEAAGEQPIFSYNQTDFVNERVAIEVQFGKYAFVAARD
ncbi:hypothetical protein AGMMS50256_12240 [Betaproteobacteria bacterium]|nr:hypothetical protein AGMMS50256_12240 [Betaproteobacteria bacterium]